MSRLLIRQRVFALTGKEFEVKAGFFAGPIFTIEEDISSIHERRKMYDDNGRKIYEMKKKILSARRIMRIKDVRTGSVVATLRRGKYTPITISRDGKIEIWRGENTEGSPWMEIDGERGGSVFSVNDMWKGVEVALVRKKSFTIPTIFLGKSSYIVEIRAGYEEALLIMITIAIDEIYSS